MRVLISEGGKVSNIALFGDGHALGSGQFNAAEYPDVTIGDDVVAGIPTPKPAPPAPTIEEQRAAMVCSPLQGQLVLGEAQWVSVEAIADDPATPFTMRQSIKSAGDWRRDSQKIDELGYLLGYTSAQMDEMFRLAMTITF